ncbi:hypothetical protein D3C80_2038970 [compost metagenome]
MIDQRREEQRNRQPDKSHHKAEFQRGVERVEIVRILKQLREVRQTGKLAG